MFHALLSASLIEHRTTKLSVLMDSCIQQTNLISELYREGKFQSEKYIPSLQYNQTLNQIYCLHTILFHIFVFCSGILSWNLVVWHPCNVLKYLLFWTYDWILNSYKANEYCGSYEYFVSSQNDSVKKIMWQNIMWQVTFFAGKWYKLV